MFYPAAGCDAVTFQPCSDKALANLKAYVDSFRNGVYSINNGVAANAAIAVGRYFEDVYLDGNPWYLTTFAVAEQLYRAVHPWDALDAGIEVTAISLPSSSSSSLLSRERPSSLLGLMIIRQSLTRSRALPMGSSQSWLGILQPMEASVSNSRRIQVLR